MGESHFAGSQVTFSFWFLQIPFGPLGVSGSNDFILRNHHWGLLPFGHQLSVGHPCSPSHTTDSPLRPEQSLGSLCLGTGICTPCPSPSNVRSPPNLTALLPTALFYPGPPNKAVALPTAAKMSHVPAKVLLSWAPEEWTSESSPQTVPPESVATLFRGRASPGRSYQRSWHVPHVYLTKEFVAMHTCIFWERPCNLLYFSGNGPSRPNCVHHFRLAWWARSCSQHSGPGHGAGCDTVGKQASELWRYCCE